MPNTLKDDVQAEYVHGTDWWIRGIVLLVILLNVLFVREILDIYRTYQMEPAYLIAMVGGLSGGEFSLVYFLTRGKKDLIRETIRYEHDFEMRPAAVKSPTLQDPYDYSYEEEIDPDSFEAIFPKDDYIL